MQYVIPRANLMIILFVLICTRASSVIVQMVNSTRRNSLTFTNNSIRMAKLMLSASQWINSSSSFVRSIGYSHWYFRYAFATFDANNDGSIDFDEFLLAIAATSQGDLDDRLEVAFEMSVNPIENHLVCTFSEYFIGMTFREMVKSIKKNWRTWFLLW